MKLATPLRALVLSLALGSLAAPAGGDALAPGLVSVPIPPPSSEPLERQGERWVGEWVRALREPASRYDARKIVADARAAAQPGEPRELFFDRIAFAVGAAFYDYAPIGATHDDGARYRLPFPLETPQFVAQGVNGRFTHQGSQRFAFDFAMPIGSPVVAARDGTVVRVRDGSKQGGLAERHMAGANEVIVLHADGTFASYVHLAPGIPVREGQAVKQGERIATSGNTGYTAGPHLHFAVSRRIAPAQSETVPIRFGVGSKQGFVPEQGQFYGGKPRQTVALAVSSNGVPLSESHPLRLAAGEKAQLAVSLGAPGASPVDVTAAGATAFFSPTGWSTTVDARGAVTGSPTPDYAAAIAKLGPDAAFGAPGWGVVVVRYEDPAKGHFGFASVPVLVGDAARR